MNPIHPEDALFDRSTRETEEGYSFKELLAGMFRGFVKDVGRTEEPKEPQSPDASSSVEQIKTISETITSSPVYFEKNIGDGFNSQNSKNFPTSFIYSDCPSFKDYKRCIDIQNNSETEDDVEVQGEKAPKKDLDTPTDDETSFDKNKVLI